MEADILKSKKDIYLVQKYGGRNFAKVKRIDILSRCMEADILKSKKDIYLVQKYGGEVRNRLHKEYYSSWCGNCFAACLVLDRSVESRLPGLNLKRICC